LLIPASSGARECLNLVGGTWRRPWSERTREIRSPYTGAVIGTVGLSGERDVAAAVTEARAAQEAWGRTPLKERVLPLLRFRALLAADEGALSETIALESGKTVAEARAGLQRGLEVVDFAASLPNLDSGGALEVSRGVTCEYRREPLGVVAGITPFNFPAMVPLWMFPIALTVGNAFILKPSEKVPLTACRLGELMTAAGYAPGLFSVVHGDHEAVNALVDHPDVRAAGFVGSSVAAKAVYVRATTLGKRALCLGGAKNHVIVAPDADEAMTVRGVVDSFTGCAGQRCMAASVLVAVGDASRFVEKIAAAASRIELGVGMGALIDHASRERLVAAIDAARADGATVVLDGRAARPPAGCEGGSFLGPTVLDHVRPGSHAATTELFGPLLSVIRAPTIEQALAIERASRYGNALSVFTSSGAVARHVAEHAGSGMVGVNVGVPVPREPFSFGGTKDSKFGHGDITGPSGVELWTDLKKITTKWALSTDATWMS
jgi:malonate-semialdehyde dehydrogenase (acetylating) / methylmalonate-semialdehyde dehydrogenase